MQRARRGNSRYVRGLLRSDEYPFDDIKVREDSSAAGRWETTAGRESVTTEHLPCSARELSSVTPE